MDCTSPLIATRSLGCAPSGAAPRGRADRPWVDRLRSAWHAGWMRWRSAWQERRARARALAELELAAELGEATLRDIGAPEWLVNEAAARSTLRREQLASWTRLGSGVR